MHEPSHGRRADAAGELREVVRPVEADRRLAPLAAVDEVVPLGDQVVDRAARRHAADQHARCGSRGCRSPCTAAPCSRQLAVGRGAGAPRSSRGSAPAAAATAAERRGDLDEAGRACPSGAAHPREVARVLLEGGHLGLLAGRGPMAAHPRLRLEDAAVVVRDDAHEASATRRAQSASSSAARSEPVRSRCRSSSSRTSAAVLRTSGRAAPGPPAPGCSGPRTPPSSS